MSACVSVYTCVFVRVCFEPVYICVQVYYTCVSMCALTRTLFLFLSLMHRTRVVRVGPLPLSPIICTTLVRSRRQLRAKVLSRRASLSLPLSLVKCKSSAQTSTAAGFAS